MTWSIEPGTAVDIDGVLALWRDTGAPQSVPDDHAAVMAVLERDPGALLVARTEDAIVGTVLATWDGWRGAMYRLAVRDDQRRRGIATTLVRAGEARLAALGARRIGAVVVEDNEAAEAFWQAAGYTAGSRQHRVARNL